MPAIVTTSSTRGGDLTDPSAEEAQVLFSIQVDTTSVDGAEAVPEDQSVATLLSKAGPTDNASVVTDSTPGAAGIEKASEQTSAARTKLPPAAMAAIAGVGGIALLAGVVAVVVYKKRQSAAVVPAGQPVEAGARRQGWV